jgi:glycosyltransferase involved in cell wall biosynthesis
MAATRFRLAAFRPHLAREGIHVEIVAALDDDAASRLYEQGGKRRAALRLGVGAARQARRVLTGNWDVLWIQREAIIAGPPIVEALGLTRRLPLVLDYDDAVWIAQGSALKRAAKFSWKFDWVLRRAAHAIAGSRSLADHARSLGTAATSVPTVVERATWRPRSPEARVQGPLVLGWIGTHSTASQLSLVAPALRRLRAEGHEFRVLVIGAGDHFRMTGVDVELRRWTLATEIEDFQSIDIGLAPMHRSPWHEGKCGFKQLQYMAVGVPCVSSMVGGARDFVVHDQNALVAETEDEWYSALLRLIVDPELRVRLARNASELIERELCTEAQAPRIAKVLRDAGAQRRR